jgi:hypothetical protein
MDYKEALEILIGYLIFMGLVAIASLLIQFLWGVL